MQYTHEHLEIQKTMRRFIDEEINPHVDEWEAAEAFPAHEVFKRMGALGLLGVLDGHLAGREWIMGDDYTIADIATFPWIRNLIGFYEAGELVGFKDFANVARVLAAFVARPAVVKGLTIPARG